MAFLRILMDCADGYREGVVVGEPEQMPNVDGKYLIRVKPMGVSGLFSTYEISNIPKNGWMEWKRPDGNITFILLMNESGKSPFLDKLKIMAVEAVKTIEEMNKIMDIKKSVEKSNNDVYSQDVMNYAKKHRAFLDELEKKNNNKDPRFGLRPNGG